MLTVVRSIGSLHPRCWLGLAGALVSGGGGEVGPDLSAAEVVSLRAAVQAIAF